MKIIITLSIFVTFASLAQTKAASASPPGQSKKTTLEEVQSILASVPIPELPAKAAQLVVAAKLSDRDAVALATIQYAASAHPGSIVALVSSVVAADPGSAAAVASSATKLVPSEAPGISGAALNAAPGQGEQIARALGVTGGNDNGNNGNGNGNNGNGNGNNGNGNGNNGNGNGNSGDNGNRPTTPPGQVDKTTPGTIRGNRPTIPPGHVRDPKPGRDPQRNHYGSP